MEQLISFPGKAVKYYFQSSFADLTTVIGHRDTVIITDSNIASIYATLFKPYKTIIIPAGEASKSLQTIESVTKQLLGFEVHKNSMLIGIGGGVVTDITGFIASIYMRGIPFGFVPTSLQAMVDATVGGKNGINFGLHKNILGTIHQPGFIFFDTGFLKTLPPEEWSNGFAEIIKYACLFDGALFEELSRNNIEYYRQNENALAVLISKCVDWKNKIVLEDENEQNKRKLLNFGHTAGHALENLYHLSHGNAVALGMIAALMISETVLKTNDGIRKKLVQLSQQYSLRVSLNFDTKKVMEILRMDKKRNKDGIDYILLQDIGKPVIERLSFDIIEQSLETFANAGHHQTR